MVLFPTRERLLDAAWRLLAAVHDLKSRDELPPASPITVGISRYRESRPELYLSSAAYDLASRITIRLRDTEAAETEQRPASCAVLVDTGGLQG